MQEIISGVHIWSELSERTGIAFNGYAVATERGTVVIDPPDPGESWALIDALEIGRAHV